MKLKEFFKGKNISILIIILFLVKLYLLFILPEMSDESMYIYKTYLMTEGWNIYKDFGDNRMPGFYLMLYPFIYLYKIVASPPYVNIIYFGRVFALISSLVSAIFIFKIGKYLRNERTGLMAVILFMVSPYALRNYTFVYLENFLTAFSLIGFYFFIRGIEEKDSKNSYDKNLFISGIFFGLATSIKQMGILIFPVVIFLLLLKYRNHFLRKVLIISSGGLLVGLVILLYFLVHGTLADFFYSITTSVRQSDIWGNPSREKIISDLIIPILKSNELLTLIFGFFGIIFSSILFFTKRDTYFGIKTLALWLACYAMVIYTFSNNYPAYYMPMLPPLVILSAYMIDNFLIDNILKSPRIFILVIVLAFIIIGIDFQYLNMQYQNFVPTEKDTIFASSLDQQISIGKYLYNHTIDKDKIFSIDPIYGLIAGREVVNHFTIKNTELPTTNELINLGLSRVKYVIIDNRTILHLKTKWNRKIENLNLSLEVKTGNKENIADGIVIELRDKNNISLWWIHAKNWQIPLNSKTVVNYDIPIEVDKWKKIDIDLSSGFNSYFGYDPKGYKFAIWANANNGSDIKFQIDKIKIWDANGIYINENFDEDVSIKNFSIEIKKGAGMGWNKIGVKDGKLNIESFNENYGLSTNISAGSLGYIFQNFEKEKDFIITVKMKKYENVSLYRKIDR